MNTRNTHAITEGVIWKRLLLFFFPILFGSFFQHLYNTADAIILGRFVGKEALAAIDSTSSMIRVLISLFVGISTGATILISQQYGARDYEGVSQAVHTSLVLSVLGGAVIMVLGWLLTPFGLDAMRIPDDIRADAALDVRIYFGGMIPSMVYNMGASILRAVGDAKRPLLFLIVSSLVNIVLDLYFVAVLHMGTAGAGLATVLSQLLSAVLVLVSLARTTQPYRLFIKRLRMVPTIARRIARTGLPIGLQSAMYPVSNMVIQAAVNGFGTNTIAAWAVCGKLDLIVWMIMEALGIAVSTFVGQNWGAGRIDRVRKSVRVGLGMSFACIVPLSIILFFFGGPLSRFFVDDAEVITLSIKLIRYFAMFYVTFICIEILGAAIRGTGETLRPMMITLFGTCVLRILWILLVVPLAPSLDMVMASYPITWSLTSVIYIIYYQRYKRRHLMPTEATV